MKRKLVYFAMSSKKSFLKSIEEIIMGDFNVKVRNDMESSAIGKFRLLSI